MIDRITRSLGIGYGTKRKRSFRRRESWQWEMSLDGSTCTTSVGHGVLGFGVKTSEK